MKKPAKPISFSVTNFIDGENNVRLFRNSNLDGAEFKYLIPAFNFDDYKELFPRKEDWVPEFPSHDEVVTIMGDCCSEIGAVAVELSAPDILRIESEATPHPFICFCRWDLYGIVDYEKASLLPLKNDNMLLHAKCQSLLNTKTQIGIPFIKSGTVKIHLYPSTDAGLDRALSGLPAFTDYARPEFLNQHNFN